MRADRIAIVGAGAVGGYIAARLAAAGRDVRIVDPWAEHVERIRAEGLRVEEPGGTSVAKLPALHLSDVHALVRSPIDLAFVCTKSYDTAWAAALIAPYLGADGCVVSVQNGINEETIAAVVGWERTLGCIASTISVEAPGPGRVARLRTPGGSAYTVFRVGEVHGRITPRAQRIAEVLGCVDSAKVTPNLWGERWSKLVTNSMHHGILGATGIHDHALMGNPHTRRLATVCAAEAIRVAQALGHPLEPILHMPPSLWLAAANGEPGAVAELEDGWTRWMARSRAPHYGSIGQDLAKGRRTEIDYVCGYVAVQGERIGVPAPTQRALYEMVKRVERGELARSLGNLVAPTPSPPLTSPAASRAASTTTPQSPHIVFIGAGAVGGYVGGQLARAGERVTLVDPWPEHVQAILDHGLRLSGSQGEHVVRVHACLPSAVQSFLRTPVDIAIVCTKSYDTDWAVRLIAPYLAPSGFVVSMQNGINEERVAHVVGWGRTLGVTVSTISVDCYQPGCVRRFQQPGSTTGHAVFRVGEIHGEATERATELARILGQVDVAKVTSNLWGERWTKLTANAITHGLLGATGLDNRHVYVERGKIHRLGVRLAAEAVAVGRAHGYELGTVLGIAPDDWYAAGALQDRAAIARVRDGLAAWMATLLAPSHSSVGRDVQRGRRSEIDFTNGLVADKARAAGLEAPTHAAVTELVRRIDRGELRPSPANVDDLPD